MFYQDMMLYSGNSELYDHCLKTDREFILTYRYREGKISLLLENMSAVLFLTILFLMRTSVFVVKNKYKTNKALISFGQFMSNT